MITEPRKYYKIIDWFGYFEIIIGLFCTVGIIIGWLYGAADVVRISAAVLAVDLFLFVVPTCLFIFLAVAREIERNAESRREEKLKTSSPLETFRIVGFSDGNPVLERVDPAKLRTDDVPMPELYMKASVVMPYIAKLKGIK